MCESSCLRQNRMGYIAACSPMTLPQLVNSRGSASPAEGRAPRTFRSTLGHFISAIYLALRSICKKIFCCFLSYKGLVTVSRMAKRMTLTFRPGDDMLARLKKYCDAEELRASQVARRALKEFLDRADFLARHARGLKTTT